MAMTFPEHTGWLERFLDLAHTRRRLVLLLAGAGIALIAALDWAVQPNITLGNLYILPILLAAVCVGRVTVILLALLCALLREILGPQPFSDFALTRDALIVVAFATAGLFVSEVVRNRQMAVAYSRRLEGEMKLRRAAEEQLRILIDTTPAAVLTVDNQGRIDLANRATSRLLGVGPDRIVGQPVANFLPDLAQVPQAQARPMQASMECRGRRADGSLFLASVSFSTFTTRMGPRLAAIVLDESEDLIEREGDSFDSLMSTSRVLVGAILHEVRNLCAAAGVARDNLSRSAPMLVGNEDFRTLASLLEGMRKIADSELRVVSSEAGSVGLQQVLDELRIVIEPQFSEIGARLEFDYPKEELLVQANHHTLMQIFLNLATNARRALEERDPPSARRLTIRATPTNSKTVVRFIDTGPGVDDPERLFRPFHYNATSTGLGLYVSRAIARAFGGDLSFDTESPETCFVLSLRRVGE